MKFVYYCAMAFLITACGESNPNSPSGLYPAPSPKKPKVFYDNYDDDFLDSVLVTAQAVHQYLDSIPDCNSTSIEGEENADQCEMVTISVQSAIQLDQEPKMFVPRDQKFTEEKSNNVLIIDTGLETGAVSHPRRMLGMYDWVVKTEDSGITVGYELTQKSYETSKASLKIRNEIMGQSSSFVPATEMTRHITPQKIWKLPDDSASDKHGTIMLNALADYLPHAQFATIGRVKFPEELVCSPDVESLTKFIADSILAVADLVHRHDISYINLSSGLIKQDFKNLIKSTCQTPSAEEDDIAALHFAYSSLLKGLAELAVLVQSGPNASASMITHVEALDVTAEHYSDCIDIPGRLTTGYLNQSYINDAELPPIARNGSNDSESYEILFRPNQLQVKGCVDLFVNTGWRENYRDFPSFGHFPILYGEDGLSAGPLNFMSTSFTSGIAIAIIDYYATLNNVSPKTSLMLLKKQKDTIDTALLFAPMRHAQLPVCYYFPGACRNWELFELKL